MKIRNIEYNYYIVESFDEDLKIDRVYKNSKDYKFVVKQIIEINNALAKILLEPKHPKYSLEINEELKPIFSKKELNDAKQEAKLKFLKTDFSEIQINIAGKKEIEKCLEVIIWDCYLHKNKFPKFIKGIPLILCDWVGVLDGPR